MKRLVGHMRLKYGLIWVVATAGLSYTAMASESIEGAHLAGSLGNDKGEFLMMKQCQHAGAKIDSDAVCYSNTEDLSSYTFVACRESETSKELSCTPVFLSDENEVLQVQLTPDSVGDNSKLKRDLAAMKSKLESTTQTRDLITGGILGSAIGLEMVYLAKRKVMANAGVLQVIAAGMALVAAGSHAISSLIPDSVPDFFGLKNLFYPQAQDAGYQPIPYENNYVLSEPDKSFVMGSMVLLDDVSDLAEEDQVYEVGDLDIRPLASVMGRALKYHNVADDESLAKACFETGLDDKVACYAVGAENSADNEVIIDVIGKEDIKGFVQVKSDELGPDASEVMTDSLAGDSAVDSEENTTSSLSASVDHGVTLKDVEALFGGADLDDIFANLDTSLCPRASVQSDYEYDLELFTAEGYVNCLMYGGGDACKQKYNCYWQIVDKMSCDQLVEHLEAVKESLNYGDSSVAGGFVDVAAASCEYNFSETPTSASKGK